MADVARVVRNHLRKGEEERAFDCAIKHLNHDEIRVQFYKYKQFKTAYLQGRIGFKSFAATSEAAVRFLLQITQKG